MEGVFQLVWSLLAAREGVFQLVWIGLLAAPVLAVVIFVLLRQRPFQVRLVVVMGSVLLLYFGVACSGLSFVAVQANFACFVVAYFAYSFLAVMCLRIPILVVRILSFVVAIVPIILGYFMSTVGVLGLAFIVDDYTRLPKQAYHVEANLECRNTLWGLAVGASGYTVSLYRSWDVMPFLHRKVASASVTEWGYSGTRPTGVSCADLLAQYQKS